LNVKFENGIITCICPDCNAVTNFLHNDSSSEFGSFTIGKPHLYNSTTYNRTIYFLYKCSGCERGGIAKVHCNNIPFEGELEEFYPIGFEKIKIPDNIPSEIVAELNEAGLCAAVKAWRAGSALVRSALEKVFISNGYSERDLFNKIEAAKKDGVITDSRAKKAHDDIRVLGNDVLHDKWRAVDPDEFYLSYHYCQRVIEDFYDDRSTVESILKSKNRI